MAEPDRLFQYNEDIVRNIFRKKEEFHRDRALLPIEEKIKILVKLQKISLTIRPKQGEEDTRTVWKL
ncbi:MAG: hypothetical protein JW768_05465 [Chitinispirillaceae bacterium]|nr:hypothetical protein [Chitinispirillaceae bacterium]